MRRRLAEKLRTTRSQLDEMRSHSVVSAAQLARMGQVVAAHEMGRDDREALLREGESARARQAEAEMERDSARLEMERARARERDAQAQARQARANETLSQHALAAAMEKLQAEGKGTPWVSLGSSVPKPSLSVMETGGRSSSSTQLSEDGAECDALIVSPRESPTIIKDRSCSGQELTQRSSTPLQAHTLLSYARRERSRLEQSAGDHSHSPTSEKGALSSQLRPKVSPGARWSIPSASPRLLSNKSETQSPAVVSSSRPLSPSPPSDAEGLVSYARRERAKFEAMAKTHEQTMKSLSQFRPSASSLQNLSRSASTALMKVSGERKNC